MQTFGFHFDTTYTTLPEMFFTSLAPESAPSPQTIIVNHTLAQSMGLTLSSLSDNALAALFSGNQLPKGATPLSQAYAGHQFGHFTMLGDGRAHLWGEHIMPNGERVDIQSKGSGRTPYSRGGDGKAALGPMLREYIVSEAMHHLGIPTTRSLAVVTTGASIVREKRLPGALLTRVASSHIRVGTFEFAAQTQDKQAIASLVDYTICRHYPDLQDNPNKALALLEAVMTRQADLMVHWMRVGFIHGVMNTDNMTLSGETIDYGPCAFMDAYDPKTVFSAIDQSGRYAYGNQPNIAHWNLARFAETLLPLIDEDTHKAVALAVEKIDPFFAMYQQKWLAMMRAKLGLFEARKEDAKLIADLLDWMHNNHMDYNNTFRDLSHCQQPNGGHYVQQPFTQWYARWQHRLAQNSQPLTSSLDLMRTVNPAIIPRNHNVEHALNAASTGDLTPLMALLAALKEPYQDNALLSAYQSPPKANERVWQTFCGT